MAPQNISSAVVLAQGNKVVCIALLLLLVSLSYPITQVLLVLPASLMQLNLFMQQKLSKTKSGLKRGVVLGVICLFFYTKIKANFLKIKNNNLS